MGVFTSKKVQIKAGIDYLLPVSHNLQFEFSSSSNEFVVQVSDQENTVISIESDGEQIFQSKESTFEFPCAKQQISIFIKRVNQQESSVYAFRKAFKLRVVQRAALVNSQLQGYLSKSRGQEIAIASQSNKDVLLIAYDSQCQVNMELRTIGTA